MASTPEVVHSATTNGISTAHERPSARIRRTRAVSTAMSSPTRRSPARTGDKSCWTAGAPVT